MYKILSQNQDRQLKRERAKAESSGGYGRNYKPQNPATFKIWVNWPQENETLYVEGVFFIFLDCHFL